MVHLLSRQACHGLVHPCPHISCHVHTHESEGRSGSLVGSRHPHGIGGRIHHAPQGHPGIVPEGHAHLGLLDLCFIRFVGFDVADPEGNDFDAPEIPPFLAQHIVEGVGQFKSVGHDFRIVDPLGTEFGKGRCQSHEQFAFHLAVQGLPFVHVVIIPAHVGVEQDGVSDPVAVFSEAPEPDGEHLTGGVILHLEGDFTGSAVFVPDQFLGVEVIHPLVLAGVPAVGEPFPHLFEDVLHIVFQVPGEDGGFGAFVVGVFPRFRTQVHHLAAFHDHHALAVVHGNPGSVADDVVVALVGAPAPGPLPALHHQDVRCHLAIKELFPLVGQNAANRAQSRFDESHDIPPLLYPSVFRPSFFQPYCTEFFVFIDCSKVQVFEKNMELLLPQQLLRQGITRPQRSSRALSSVFFSVTAGRRPLPPSATASSGPLQIRSLLFGSLPVRSHGRPWCRRSPGRTGRLRPPAGSLPG